jgi:uncharacterized protein (UPF0332 family)
MMPIEPKELLELAEEGLKRDDEVFIRSSVSRAYYCCYHSLQNIASRCPQVDRTNLGDHAALVKKLTKVPKKGFLGAAVVRDIGYKLGQMRKNRVIADYTLSADMSKDTLKWQLADAKTVAQKIKEHDELLGTAKLKSEN